MPRGRRREPRTTGAIVRAPDPSVFQGTARQPGSVDATDALIEARNHQLGYLELDQTSDREIVRYSRRTGAYHRWKRWLDVAAVVLFSPAILLMCAVVSLIVLVTSGRPVLFRQTRVGKGGRPFQIVKFRTMHLDAEKKGPTFAEIDDDRTTPLGAWLRRYRLDELPQFWNVLRGEMSIIGPRPEQQEFADLFNSRLKLYAHRHAVLPGITGWAQVNYGYASDMTETTQKLSFDLYYVKYSSFWLDVKIVFLTILTILRGFGAR